MVIRNQVSKLQGNIKKHSSKIIHDDYDSQAEEEKREVLVYDKYKFDV